MPFSFQINGSDVPRNFNNLQIESDLNRQLLHLQEIFTEQKAKIDELDDPLSIFESYHQQLNQLLQIYSNSLPNSACNDSSVAKLIISILVPVLDSATQTFARDPRYKNDSRYLKLWLAYSKYCREAEDIFIFLCQEGIAQELATYYEEYALLLSEKNPKQANLIFQKGIEKKAQPLERLKKKYAEFESKYRISGIASALNGLNTGNVGKAIEVRGYDSKMIQEGEFSFEEIRALNWYSKPKIFKPSLTDLLQPKYRLPPVTNDSIALNNFNPFPTIQTIENTRPVHDLTTDIEDENAPGLGLAVNPDDLTHINVFKDNTADLREISKLVKANKTNLKSPVSSNINPKKKTDWFLKDIMMSFSPIKKKPHLEDTVPSENKANNFNILNTLTSCNNSDSNSITKAPKTDLTTNISQVSFSQDLFPIASDNSKSESNFKTNCYDPIGRIDYSHLMDPFDLDFKIAQCEAVLAQIASAIPNLNLRLNETASTKVRSFEKSLGRDGSGPNHTVSSLRIASGHFFMEQKLGEGGYGKVFLGVDLMKDEAEVEVEIEDNNDKKESDGVYVYEECANVNQVAIKIEAPASVWESYIIFRIQSHLNKCTLNCTKANVNANRHFPGLISASIYSDISFLVMDYYEQGSLLSALNVYRQQNTPTLDESIVLFYAAELLKLVITIHEAGILHTDIKLENLLILSPHGSNNSTQSTWSSNFKRDGSEGWKDRGLVLIDFGRAIDLKLLKDEEQSRFFIKSKHESFNGSPRIVKGLDVSHEMDWYGVADCLHWLLFQKPLSLQSRSTTQMAPVSISDSGSGSSSESEDKFKLANSFKRYWQINIWELLFQDLLNPPLTISMAIEKFKFHLDKIFCKLENWRKTPSMKSLLTRQEIMLYENKK